MAFDQVQQKERLQAFMIERRRSLEVVTRGARMAGAKGNGRTRQ
ncbi:hypothetical protein OPIT5_25910 [Opitutaceae bacterium TAV5]|nr:hypothetical protein OPIT5_25910 [Opitutaceae bacterium TAV5]